MMTVHLIATETRNACGAAVTAYRDTANVASVTCPACLARCSCGCPDDMHVGEIGCPCGLPDEVPCVEARSNLADDEAWGFIDPHGARAERIRRGQEAP